MEEAIRVAFAEGNFESVLDKLSVPSMNTQRKYDGRTPLMAACAHGNKPVVDLLLDLLCSEHVQDSAGKTAMDYAVEAGYSQLKDEILRRRALPVGEDGKPVYTWEQCPHPPESKYLDEEIGWLICTGCGLVLKENAIQLSADDESNPYRKMAAVRGADQEYSAWRAQELELADIMSQLGIVDNEAAKRTGEATSIWAGRKQALAWLDKRKRHIASWQHRAKLAQLENKPIPAKTQFPAYVRGVDYEQETQKLGTGTSSSADTRTRLPRFRGRAPMDAVSVEEEELIDPAQIVADKYAPKPTRWRIAIARWDAVAGGVLQWNRQRRLQEAQSLRQEEREQEDEIEREIEWEYT